MQNVKKTKKTGIVILNYNGAELLELTLESLARAKTQTPWVVCVVDNGSKQVDCEAAHKAFNRIIVAGGFAGEFIDVGENKGFSGGNNVALEWLLQDETITHLCLLNSDVIVPDGWLDGLICEGKDITGPITNAAGNEQTVTVDFTAQQDTSAIAAVNTYAKKRAEIYAACAYETDIVTFFCTVFSREVMDTIGLLDERFFPGSFEDDDYCVRAQQAGFKLWVMRGCYVHHWGSGSFEKLAMDSRVRISQENRLRFEEKWHTQWKDRRWKLLESCRQDADWLMARPERSLWAERVLERGFDDMETMLDKMCQQENDCGAAIANCSAELAAANAELAALRAYANDVPARALLRQIAKKIRRRFSLTYWRTRPQRVAHRAAKERKRRIRALETKLLEAMRLGVRGRAGAVAVLAPIFNAQNITDGYFQRIKAVDGEVLADYYKVYINLERAGEADVDIVDDGHVEVCLDARDPLQIKLLRTAVRSCGMVYIHSVLRVMADKMAEKTRRVFAQLGVTTVWDMHGSVPEEFALHGDYYGAQLAGEAEEFLAAHAAVVVTVNEAMKAHLQKKYGEALDARVVVMPIFNADLLQTIDCAADKTLKKGDKPMAVYAGGLQKWQKIEQMQQVIAEAGDCCRYEIFVPRPAEFNKAWPKKAKRPANMVVECKRPEELKALYRACHYGFVLRDDITVNNVACPTKLIEYLQYGIVPVLDTPHIGDFVALGMQYIDWHDFAAGKLPTEKARAAIATSNYAVLQKLTDAYVSGRASVTDALPRRRK